MSDDNRINRQELDNYITADQPADDADEGNRLADNPYNTDVHLDAGVYNGLYRDKFEEGCKAQLLFDKQYIDFAFKVATVMNDIRSSHVFFILTQAYGDMDWEEAQKILNGVLGLKEGWK